jgi:dihydropteroate synthase
VLLGAHIVRVHNVPDMVDVVRVADAIREVRRAQR